MLAYVFSHRPADGIDVESYEGTLRRFHEALAGAAPDGFISSSTFRIGGGYSDWYLVDNSAALDALNAAAVSGARAAAHDAAARVAVDGVGKLLSLVSGQPSAGEGFEVRFAKAAGMSYAELYGLLGAWTGLPGSSLWRRMMVLGPAPEFCLVAPTAVELPLRAEARGAAPPADLRSRSCASAGGSRDQRIQERFAGPLALKVKRAGPAAGYPLRNGSSSSCSNRSWTAVRSSLDSAFSRS